ncbi:MAG: 2Fe-2S iron-sulfur cluster binding domain-containing protein [Gammaproteobacteria bacterium]|jgi:ferredoxin, 2Fe-2S|nr:2Fe-2S iron-sulfur cluster binding domain-containing protein [Gammaproteobacteria bacterium]MBT4493696.1 2Fe-2S iron-sulfur cluster binding domain-containing protein [Gammaproteobacteria bacterium]MBT7370401.1 2Fe-2S iron-sulfur cluster binding domain-containing protein [Gammaproteobacteria bacterium]
MPQVKFIEFNGTEHVVDASKGESIMVAATNNLVPGIDADCGGECSCATCHVLIDADWQARLGARSEQEESMLDLNPDRTDESRLSCQIPMTDELDGITVRLPEFQY